MDALAKTIPRPADYTCPLSPEACEAIEQLVQLEQAQLYSIQQCGLCGLTLEKYEARSRQRMALASLIREHVIGGQ